MFRAVDWRLTAAWLFYRACRRRPSFMCLDDTVRPSRVVVDFLPPQSTLVLSGVLSGD